MFLLILLSGDIETNPGPLIAHQNEADCLSILQLNHTRETVNLYAVGVLYKINLTCLGGPADMYKQTRGE